MKMARISVFFTVVALIAGMVGCVGGDADGGSSYTLIIDITAGGTVTVDNLPLPGKAILTYDAGTVVSLNAIPSADYRFVNWTGNATTIDDANAASTTITIDDDYFITANFMAQYILTLDSTDGGYVTTPGEGMFTYDAGTVVDLVAQADEGYYFINWAGDVGTISKVNAAITVITLNRNCTITANFNSALSFFDKDSYLPIVENATWTYNYGSTVKVTNVDTWNNEFMIENIGSSGWMRGISGQDPEGKYIASIEYDSSEFLPVRLYFGFRPLLYEDSRMTLGFSWEDSGTSRGYSAVYPYHNRLTVVSTGINITTPGGQVYENCIVLQRDISYPNGYFWNPYLAGVVYYVKEGIGFVQEIQTWSNGSQVVNYLTSCSIP